MIFNYNKKYSNLKISIFSKNKYFIIEFRSISKRQLENLNASKWTMDLSQPSKHIYDILLLKNYSYYVENTFYSNPMYKAAIQAEELLWNMVLHPVEIYETISDFLLKL